VAFGLFQFVQDHAFSAYAVAWAISSGLVYFVIGGVFAVPVWAFARFRASDAALPLVLWLIFGSGMAFISDQGYRLDRNSKLQKFTSEGLAGKDRDDAVRSIKQMCVQNQTANPLTPKLGIKANTITAYCDCLAEGMASAVSIDEIKVIISTGKPPASLTEKGTTLGNFCSQQVFAK
jgi:hypothetical protein